MRLSSNIFRFLDVNSFCNTFNKCELVISRKNIIKEYSDTQSHFQLFFCLYVTCYLFSCSALGITIITIHVCHKGNVSVKPVMDDQQQKTILYII